MNYSIPVVDLNDYLSGEKECVERFVRGVGSALQEVGFFALTNHNVDAELIHESYVETKKLFELSIEDKLAHQVPGLNGQRGYTSFGKEHAKGSDAPDLKEFYQYGQVPRDNYKEEEYPANVAVDEVERYEQPVDRDDDDQR